MITFTGHKNVILKSGGETAITTLKSAARAAGEVDMGAGISPAGGSKDNGESERAVQTFQGQGRTMKSAFGHDYKTGFKGSHAHAMDGSSRLVPHKRIHDRRGGLPGA